MYKTEKWRRKRDMELRVEKSVDKKKMSQKRINSEKWKDRKTWKGERVKRYIESAKIEVMKVEE